MQAREQVRLKVSGDARTKSARGVMNSTSKVSEQLKSDDETWRNIYRLQGYKVVIAASAWIHT